MSQGYAGLGILGTANGGSATSVTFTAGSIIFAGANGVYSQDNANFFYNSTNKRIGLREPAPAFDAHLVGADSAEAVASLEGYNGSPRFLGRRASGTKASPTATAVDSNLAVISGRGYSGGFTTDRAAIALLSAETFTGTAQGAYITFSTTPTGSTTIAERMRIDGDGVVRLKGGANPTVIDSAIQLKLGGGGTAATATSLSWGDGTGYALRLGPIILSAFTQRVTFWDNGGIEVGAPTGGNKGIGTINAGAVYDDNVLLTDWAFDLYFDGTVRAGDCHYRGQRLYPFAETFAMAQADRRLPWMPSRDAFEDERGLGTMVTRLWFGQEQQQMYLFDHERRITELTAEVARLRAELAGRN